IWSIKPAHPLYLLNGLHPIGAGQSANRSFLQACRQRCLFHFQPEGNPVPPSVDSPSATKLYFLRQWTVWPFQQPLFWQALLFLKDHWFSEEFHSFTTAPFG